MLWRGECIGGDASLVEPLAWQVTAPAASSSAMSRRCWQAGMRFLDRRPRSRVSSSSGERPSPLPSSRRPRRRHESSIAVCQPRSVVSSLQHRARIRRSRRRPWSGRCRSPAKGYRAHQMLAGRSACPKEPGWSACGSRRAVFAVRTGRQAHIRDPAHRRCHRTRGTRHRAARLVRESPDRTAGWRLRSSSIQVRWNCARVLPVQYG